MPLQIGGGKLRERVKSKVREITGIEVGGGALINRATTRAKKIAEKIKAKRPRLLEKIGTWEPGKIVTEVLPKPGSEAAAGEIEVVTEIPPRRKMRRGMAVEI